MSPSLLGTGYNREKNTGDSVGVLKMEPKGRGVCLQRQGKSDGSEDKFSWYCFDYCFSESSKAAIWSERNLKQNKNIWNLAERHIFLKVNTQKSRNHASVFLFGLQLREWEQRTP